MSCQKEQDVAVQCYEENGPSNTSSRALDGELLAPDIRPAAEKRLVRMLDSRLLPAIILILLMNYIGVSPFSRARLRCQY